MEARSIPKLIPSPKRRGRRWLRYLALSLALLIGLGAVGGYRFLSKSLPQVTGSLAVTGLRAPVTVYRDARGVPHIEASNDWDVYLAQGYVTAQDRLFQMDLTRRAASGRLSEVMGASQVETDKFFRALMLRRSAERSVAVYSDWAIEAAEAYAAGVNAYIQDAVRRGALPPEFTLLGYEPEPWTPVDSASIGKLMAYDLGGNWDGEVYRHQLREQVGDELALQLFPTYPEAGINIIKSASTGTAPAFASLPPMGDGALNLDGLLAGAVIPDEFVGSNNWVISGELTATGKPLLADDPHLGLRTPAIWYATHLRVTDTANPLNVIGATFAGVPGIVLGHNDQVAWGVTNTGPDVQDLYIEKRHESDPYLFLYQDIWERATVYDEPILVKGGRVEPFEVVVTRHGPIISEIAGSEENRPTEALALRWTAHDPTVELEAVLQMNRAQNWEQFREGLRKFQVPTQNFVFAAQDGTIAYKAAGIVPIRKQGDGLVPVPGWTGEFEWDRMIPFDDMPEVVNPPQGYIATANNRVVGPEYPYLLSHSWAQPYRADRIEEVLTASKGMTVADMQALQVDYANLQARWMVPQIAPILATTDLTDLEQKALNLMSKDWDFVDHADQGGPLVFHSFIKHLMRELYIPLMGEDLFKRMADSGNVTDEIVRQALLGQENDWVKAAGGLETLLTRSFKLAVAEVAERHGKNPAKWQWGQFHRIGPAHPIGGAVKQLGYVLNPKALPVGGSNITVGAMSFSRTTGMVSSAAPWRMVVDLADIQNNSHDIVAPGQSGHFLSRWYADQHRPHAKGELYPQLMAPGAYQQGKELTLLPAQ